ncbi:MULTISPECIES: type VI secretion system-associated protein TagF [unclassified Ruegeria]|uniref:type VI secretion system-associated protein TagF n=1 Tax=unclassified Ruegeria TaxID=2625375 RepID=UPI001ADBA943|nr:MULTISPECIES: type VI secretion system-associated protein TagF [unclassified Ruegeria]MBO9413465.1 type VI secretion system-associated protein TagF [Ruegeria sp. R8_1]MBO9417352.1 type VI secretion system-associated protein TagF [Ruegeria sp. R8_2]
MQRSGFGAFGKMPSVGDFFRLGVTQDFVQPWDTWIQHSMLATSEALGASWDAHYMSAPIWRFCLAPGLAGQQKMLGVLMPSVDRVGRRFPLTLVAGVSNEGSAILTHFRADAVYRQLEDLALAALEDDMTRDKLAEGLEALPVPLQEPTSPVRAEGKTLVLTRGEVSDSLLPDLAAGLVAHRYRSPTIWSTDIGGVPRMMVCEGLPQGSNMQGLFNLHAAVWTEARPL